MSAQLLLPTDAQLIRMFEAYQKSFETNSFRKDRVLKTTCEAWTIKCDPKIEAIKRADIKDHEEVISLYLYLKQLREEQVQSFGCVEEAAVDNSVKFNRTARYSRHRQLRVTRKALQDATEAEK